MRNKSIKLIFFAAILLAVSISAAAQSGKISGKLTYPGEGIPTDLVLCVTVTSLYAEPTYCSDDSSSRLTAAKIAFRVNRRGATYTVTLPAASYYIYAKTGEMRGHKAYYNDFVKCGMSVDCTSKTPIVVKVKAGQTRTGITVGDFWD